MGKTTPTTFALVMGLAIAAPIMPAAAALVQSKVWVSNAGVDSASCGSIASPCATFQQAILNVAAGGEVGVLTPGDFSNGSTSIAKSVHITNDGTGEASIFSPSPNTVALTISANPGDIVGLRGLVIDGHGTGAIGIHIAKPSAVHIQNCVIRNFEVGQASGIFVLQGGSSGGQIFISDSLIYNNGSAAATGGIVLQSGTTASLNVVLDRVHLENNVVGLLVDGTRGTGNGVHVILRDSVVSGNASHGIQALSAPGRGPAFLVIERTTSVNNAGTGILANGPGATMLLDDNTVTRNGAGISVVNSGQLISYGNNRVNNNLGADGVPTGNFSPL